MRERRGDVEGGRDRWRRRLEKGKKKEMIEENGYAVEK